MATSPLAVLGGDCVYCHDARFLPCLNSNFRAARSHPRGDSVLTQEWFETLVRMGQRDVEKLLKSISRKGKKEQGSLYIRTPANCVEAIGVLRG